MIPPLYDVSKTYEENGQKGPYFSEDVPLRPPLEKRISFLGFSLRSRIGIPAGPLLNSRWIGLAAQLGFDILTYKTIRSSAHAAHPLPNMIPVTLTSKAAFLAPQFPHSSAELTVTNSFGMPSQSPLFLLEDIPKALDILLSGQLLIVSVVGTVRKGFSLLQDFVKTARLAKDAGAPVIEANFSCPNVGKEQGALFLNPATVYEFSKAISQAIHPIPLLLKIGYIPSFSLLREVFKQAARGGASGICAINSLSMPVKDSFGKPALGATRPTSGICGSSIRPYALEFIRQAHQIIKEEVLDLVLLGCGGISEEHHFDEFLLNGAHIAMSATAMMWDPLLAIRYHRRLSEQNKSNFTAV